MRPRLGLAVSSAASCGFPSQGTTSDGRLLGDRHFKSRPSFPRETVFSPASNLGKVRQNDVCTPASKASSRYVVDVFAGMTARTARTRSRQSLESGSKTSGTTWTASPGRTWPDLTTRANSPRSPYAAFDKWVLMRLSLLQGSHGNITRSLVVCPSETSDPDGQSRVEMSTRTFSRSEFSSRPSLSYDPDATMSTCRGEAEAA
jgi:hypothetical protein